MSARKAGLPKPRKTIDKRCKVDKLLGIDKPPTKHSGGQSRPQIEASRTFQAIIKQNASILDYFHKQQEIEQETIMDLIDEDFSTDEEEFTETGTQIQPDE